ncbi:MAG: BolA/IbaG family iron-sulfur metabolism protein [Porticoccaceae bacterium]|nr:BolA/IbaG family iron-sulfur metabolism protein [Porticoccaceae bacterium]
MDAELIINRLQTALDVDDVQAVVEGNHVSVTLAGSVFEGLRAVQRQQKVYGVLNDLIASGAIHAVNIKAYTPAEWQAL